MFKHFVAVLTVSILIVIVSCAISVPKPGTGGKRTAKKIERTDHPNVPEGVSCYVCHKGDIPEYEFHKDYGNKCEECHDKNTWMAKKYSHPVWVKDRYHDTRCTRCHIKANEHNFAFYQCYGCHHEEKAEKKFHADLGLEEISNCIACHKSTPDD